jgi:hypothetical protein
MGQKFANSALVRIMGPRPPWDWPEDREVKGPGLTTYGPLVGPTRSLTGPRIIKKI